MSPLSPRLAAVVEALPLAPGSRVLEIGGAPGAAARAVAARVAPGGHVRVVDRSERGIAQTVARAAAEIAAGVLSTRCVAVEDLALEPGEAPYDVVFANRVGAFDGRQPGAAVAARAAVRASLAEGGRFFVDGREQRV